MQSKCDMCIDRVQNGLLPACVSSCPTETMQFGDFDEILAIATKRLEDIRKYRPNTALTDPRDVRMIFLCEDNPRHTTGMPWPPWRSRCCPARLC